jgi:hypothetical protein
LVNPVSSKEREIKIGQLLQALGLVKETQLHETLRLAVQAGLPLGRALIAAGHLNEEELNVALELQTFIRAGDLLLPEAIRVFGLVTTERITLPAALEMIGHSSRHELPAEPSRFGILLLDAQLVTQKQLNQAERMSLEAGVSVERALGLLGFIPHAVLARATELQSMVRDAKITYRDAVKLLGPKGSFRIRASREIVQYRPRVRLVEMLIVSGVLSESDLMNAIDEALTTGKSLQELLIETGGLSQDAIRLAVQLQQSIGEGDLTLQAAADALRYVATKNGGIDPASHALSGLPPDPIRLGDLLQLAGFIDAADIQQALETSARYGSLIGKMLVVAGAISETMLLASLRAQSLLRGGQIMCDDAVRTLQYAERTKKPFDDALQDLKIDLIGEPVSDKNLTSH